MKRYFILISFFFIVNAVCSQDTYRIRIDLGDAIHWAEEMLQDFDEGDSPGQVPPGIYWDLEEEVNRAIGSYNNFEAEFTELYNALQNLSNKGYEFLDSVISPEDLTLQEYTYIREKADSLLENTSAGSESGQFPVYAYYQLIQVIAEGEEYLQDYPNPSSLQIEM